MYKHITIKCVYFWPDNNKWDKVCDFDNIPTPKAYILTETTFLLMKVFTLFLLSIDLKDQLPGSSIITGGNSTQSESV